MSLACGVTMLVLAGTPTLFPVDKDAGLSDFENQAYDTVFASLKEPSLHAEAAKVDSTVYRLTIVPTWGNSVTVRLTIVAGKGLIIGKRLDGQGGYGLGKLEEQRAASLDSEQVDEFERLFAGLNFGKLLTEDTTRGRDGAIWILERVEDGSHHAVVRWSPDFDTRKRGLSTFVAVAEWLYRRSPLKGDVTNKGSVEISKEPAPSK